MEKQIVYINGRFLTQRITGVQRFAINIVNELDNELIHTENINLKIILLIPLDAVVGNFNLKKIEIRKVGLLTGHLWEQIELPFFSRNRVLINFCNVGPAFKRKQFVTICDAAVFRFPLAYKTIFVVWYRILAYLNSFFSKGVITISEFSKKELMHFLKTRKDKIFIIYPGVKFPPYEEEDILRKLNLKINGYFLAVGSLDFRKNFTGITNAFAQLPVGETELVIVGGGYSKVFSEQTISDNSKIKWTGYLNDNELISLYKNALAFVYPSFYEGFGIPPLEAMSLLCPVIVSNVASLPEVCGDAAIYCDPYNSKSIMEAMLNLVTNPDLRRSLIEKGTIRVPLFSYEQSAKKLLTLLDV